MANRNRCVASANARPKAEVPRAVVFDVGEDTRLARRVPDAHSAPILSIVVPVFNEGDGIAEFHRRLIAVLDQLGAPTEVIYVNDGSADGSLGSMHDLRSRDSRIAIVNLSRNFGKEIAITAGLDHACGAAAIVIDADLQDPPEVIPLLVEEWAEGYDMVCARRRERRGETWTKRATARLFYRLMSNIGETPIPQDTGDFRLLSRRCLDALAGCRERRRFMKGLFAWVGFQHTEVLYDRDPRFAGQTKWNYWRLWNFAIEGITSFTITPLKLATYFGVSTAVASMLYAAFIVARTLVFGREVPGYASLMVVILFLSGVQLIAMGVVGEYVGRIFVESKGRPLYLLDAYLKPHGFGDPMESRRMGIADGEN
jgi:glycosyltransferase involved in cell wall biosynthesis